jgi:hypothetical protein
MTVPAGEVFAEVVGPAVEAVVVPAPPRMVVPGAVVESDWLYVLVKPARDEVAVVVAAAVPVRVLREDEVVVAVDAPGLVMLPSPMMSSAQSLKVWMSLLALQQVDNPGTKSRQLVLQMALRQPLSVELLLKHPLVRPLVQVFALPPELWRDTSWWRASGAEATTRELAARRDARVNCEDSIVGVLFVDSLGVVGEMQDGLVWDELLRTERLVAQI